MPKYIAPKSNETRKVYLHRAYGIGNGAGRGRISAEGHALIATAMDKGHEFPDLLAAAAPKVSKPKPVKASEPKAVVPQDKRAEVKGIDPTAIREWARKNGHVVSERGRIKAEVTLAYLDAVPVDLRASREDNGKDLREAAPRTRPVGTTFRTDFTFKGEAQTLILNDRSACKRCGVSAGWCGCAVPDLTVGYNDGPVRVTVIMPKGMED